MATSLLLRHVEGLASAELAKTIGKTESELERILEDTRTYLRQMLIKSGCHFN
jgi:DNA-directed RNA polymerase specialized sigma24 family protein